jgi:uncharacterized membrane protein
MLKRLPCTTAITFLFGLFLTVGVQAQSTGTITGVVTDSTTGNTLPGVNVVVQELNSGGATNPNGRYTISGVPTGSHTLVASFVGYDRKETTVTVSAGETVEVDLSLVPSTVGMEEVVVTSLGIEQEERSLGYSVQEVGAAEIASAQEANIVNALEAQTTFSAASERPTMPTGRPFGPTWRSTASTRPTLTPTSPTGRPSRTAATRFAT